MGQLRRLTVDVVSAAGREPYDAEAIVGRAWRPPDPVALAHPLADLPALFGALRRRGARIAVATSDDRAPTEATLEALGIAPLIDALVCADDGLPVKPDPAMILHLCELLEVDPRRVAMVGDAPADLEMAGAAGVGLRVGVLSGVGRRADLEPLADVIVPSIASLTAG
jgi:phosphoglycolate phosphatase